MSTRYSSWSTRWLLRIHVVCLIATNIQTSDDISWKLLTKPAIFGGDLILECKFPEKTCCDRFARRWLGGKDLRLLVMNGASVYPQKYSERFDPDSYSSKLIIHSLNSTDVNFSYACTYGFVKDVKVLKLTEEDFESYPSEPLDANITTSTENILFVNISMQQAFPKPRCTVSFDHRDISDFMKLFAVMTKLLYAVTITVSYQIPLSSCLSLFHIICRIGTKIYEIERNVTCINYTTPMIDMKSKIVHKTFLALTSIALVVFMVVGFMIIFRKKNDDDKYDVRVVYRKQAKEGISRKLSS